MPDLHERCENLEGLVISLATRLAKLEQSAVARLENHGASITGGGSHQPINDIQAFLRMQAFPTT